MLQEITEKGRRRKYSRTLTELVHEYNIANLQEDQTTADTIKTYLSKYLAGRAVPNQKNLVLWLKLLTERIGLEPDAIIEEHLSSTIIESQDVVVDATSLLFDTRKLGIIAFLISQSPWLKELKAMPNLVLTVETDGLPFAYAVASSLGIPCLYARKRKPVGITDVLSVDLEATASRTVTLYVPETLLKNDKVLIVDDVVRSGRTQRKLVELVKIGGGEPVGLLSLIGVGKRWEELESLGVPMKILYEIPLNES